MEASARRVFLSLMVVATVASCADDVAPVAMTLRDPLDLIDDVEGPLRAYVLPADGFTCDATTGTVSPEVRDLPEGMFVDAVADVSIPVMASAARTELEVLAGSYVVLVRGKGTDPVTGIPNQFIATGCADTVIEVGDTRETRITLIPIIGMGVCGDSVPSPDEQCEDGNTTPGDGCSATCRTEPFGVSVSGGTLRAPSLGGAIGQRWIASWDVDNQDTFLRLLEPDGSAIETPSALTGDVDLDVVLPGEVASAELQSSVAVASGGRIALAFTDFAAGGAGDARVTFLGQNRTAEGPSVSVGPAPGTTEPSIAFADNGAAMVVFEDAASATGLSGRVFAAGSASPMGAAAFAVGAGVTGGQAVRIAGASDHFAVTFEAAGNVYVQRFSADGTPRDANAIDVAEGAGMQSAPSVAAQPDGRVLVAWRDTEGDGAGSAVRARHYGADGSASAIFTLNTTTAGDQGAPTVAAGNGVFAASFTSGGSVRARVVSADGDPLPNREQPPTTADFEIAASGSAPVARIAGPSDAPVLFTLFASGGTLSARTVPVP